MFSTFWWGTWEKIAPNLKGLFGYPIDQNRLNPTKKAIGYFLTNSQIFNLTISLFDQTDYILFDQITYSFCRLFKQITYRFVCYLCEITYSLLVQIFIILES